MIKIDTDGHEYQVLQGAAKMLKDCHPIIIFEIGLYLLAERTIKFEQYYEFLTSHGYNLINSKNGRVVTTKNYLKEIPLNYTTDIIAITTGNFAHQVC